MINLTFLCLCVAEYSDKLLDFKLKVPEKDDFCQSDEIGQDTKILLAESFNLRFYLFVGLLSAQILLSLIQFCRARIQIGKDLKAKQMLIQSQSKFAINENLKEL